MAALWMVALALIVLQSGSTEAAHTHSHDGIEQQTPNKLEYKFFAVSTGAFHFKVKASNDARIALTSGPVQGDPMYELFLGGWGNTKCAIRRNRRRPDVFTLATPNLLNNDEHTGFWVRWSGGLVTVEKEGETTPFISWQDSEPFTITHVGIGTGWGSKGHWFIDGSHVKG